MSSDNRNVIVKVDNGYSIMRFFGDNEGRLDDAVYKNPAIAYAVSDQEEPEYGTDIRIDVLNDLAKAFILKLSIDEVLARQSHE